MHHIPIEPIYTMVQLPGLPLLVIDISRSSVHCCSIKVVFFLKVHYASAHEYALLFIRVAMLVLSSQICEVQLGRNSLAKAQFLAY